MTSYLPLDWPILAVSLFNTILLLWLGMTVLLTVERPVRRSQRARWGVWMVGGGFLLGGVFFFSHTAILGLGLSFVSAGLDFWWRLGWFPVIISPLTWYIASLWFAGYWNDPPPPLHRRQRLWLILMVTFALLLLGLLVFANALPSFLQIIQLDLSAAVTIGGVPLLIPAFVVYILLCITLSFDALLNPGPAERIMGAQARQRARPWLMATAALLLLVGLLVGGIIFWVLLNARARAYDTRLITTVAWADLAIETLIGIATLTVGQAIVSYEIFTGHTLPRRGLQRQWRRAVILAGGYGVVIGGALAASVRPIYSLLLTVLLMTVFFALLNWRSYRERERFVAQLRPFISSQHLYENLLTQTEPASVDVETPFRALCGDLLGAQRAALVPLGPQAALVGNALAYPQPDAVPPISLSGILPRFTSPQTICVPLQHPAPFWVVSLWGAQGLTGVLILGEKRDGGLYTQEEMEIARTVGERLVDTQASAEMARHLMTLRRQRLAESQMVDHRTRRILHDDILPQLHAALLTLDPAAQPEAIANLTATHQQIAALLREMPAATAPEFSRKGVWAALRLVAEGELAGAFEAIAWETTPEAEARLHALSPLRAEALFYAAREAMRNAAQHGRAPGLRVAVSVRAGLQLLIEDDGGVVGKGGKTPGAGQGLALHSAMMAVAGGTLAFEQGGGSFTRLVLSFPD